MILPRVERGRHRERERSTDMHTDDEVAPRVTRKGAAYLMVVGGLVLLVGILVTVIGLQRGIINANQNAQLSRTEVQQLRDFLSERSAQRDEERARTQAQIDAQNKALCDATRVILADPEIRPVSKQALASAYNSLHCGSFTATGGSPSSSSSPATSGSTSGTVPSASSTAGVSPTAGSNAAPTRAATATVVAPGRTVTATRTTTATATVPGPTVTAPAPSNSNNGPILCPLTRICIGL